MITTTPVAFGEGQTLLSMLTVPEGETHCPGVVICAPFGHEHTMAYRPLRTLAQRIAEEGRPVIRFDWPGAGDSADAASNGLSGARKWTVPTAEAVELMREITGTADVSLVGLGVGATVAVLAAAADPAVSEVVLLAPFATGRAFLQDLQELHAATAHLYSEPPDAQSPPLPVGAIEASGYVFGAGDVEALRDLDLATTDLSALADSRVLVLVPEEGDDTRGLARLLEGSATEVAYERSAGLRSMWSGANASYLPASCRHRVCGWLRRSPRPHGAHKQSSRAIPRTTEISLGNGESHEEAIYLETPRGQSFGVICNPPSRMPAGDAWVVFLNSARVRRTGPNRLWTTYARTWARAGLPSLRLDSWGCGDSDGSRLLDELPLQIRKQFYASGVGDDIAASLTWLAQNRGARRFALVGLCSGAYWAFHTALADTRVGAIAMINAPWLFGHERPLRTRQAVRNMKRIALNPGLWPDALQGQERRFMRELLWANTLEVARFPGRSFGQELMGSFEHFHAHGVSVLMVFTEGDRGLPYLERHLGPHYRSLLEKRGVSFDLVRGPDHTFRPLWSHDRLRSAIEDQFRGLGLLSVEWPGQDTTEIKTVLG